MIIYTIIVIIAQEFFLSPRLFCFEAGTSASHRHQEQSTCSVPKDQNWYSLRINLVVNGNADDEDYDNNNYDDDDDD